LETFFLSQTNNKRAIMQNWRIKKGKMDAKVNANEYFLTIFYPKMKYQKNANKMAIKMDEINVALKMMPFFSATLRTDWRASSNLNGPQIRNCEGQSVPNQIAKAKRGSERKIR
jgi:hypothetical protein